MRYSATFIKICISITLIFFIFFPKVSRAECIWINKSNALAGYELTALAVNKKDPDVLYIGSKGFLFRTSDGGESWKDILNVPGTNKAVNSIAIYPENPKIIYAATESGLFKSIDGGESWQGVYFGAEKDNVLQVIIGQDNNDILFASTEKGVFVTEDGGINWKSSSQGLSGTHLSSIAQNRIKGDILFVAAGDGLFRSLNGGKQWAKVFSESLIIEEEGINDEYSENELPVASSWVSLDPSDPNIVYLATKRGVFKSADNGDSWSMLPKTGLHSPYIKNLSLSSYNNGFIFAATEKGAFRFSEEENMWREIYSGLRSKEAAFIALNGPQNALWLATKDGVYKSKGDIYEIKGVSAADIADAVLQNFSHEPTFREIQEEAIKYAEVHPEKIAKWRRAAKQKALLPKLSFGIEKDKSKSLHWDAGANPDTWVVGPEDEDTGWDITCTWDLGELIWNEDQTSIDVRSKLMVQLRDDILDEATHLYFERRRLQIELMQNPPEDVSKLIEKELRLQELTADIDAMTGGYLSREIASRKTP